MKTLFSFTLIITLLLSFSTPALAATPTPASISGNITAIQTAAPWDRWFFWNIIAAIFDVSGMIRNNFIIAFQSIEWNSANTIPRWDGWKFVQGSLIDNGGWNVQLTLPATIASNNVVTAGYVQNIISPDGNIYRCPYVDTSSCASTCTWQLSSSSFCTDYQQYRHKSRDRRCRPAATHQCELVSGVAPVPPAPTVPNCPEWEVPVLVDNQFICQVSDWDDSLSETAGKFRDGFNTDGTRNSSFAVYNWWNVGINRNTPEARLHVNGSMMVNHILAQDDTWFKSIFAWRHTNTSVNLTMTWPNRPTWANRIFFARGNNELLSIDGVTGNVGIWVSPNTTDRLTVNGNIQATGTISAATPTNDNHLTTKSYVDNRLPLPPNCSWDNQALGWNGSTWTCNTLESTGWWWGWVYNRSDLLVNWNHTVGDCLDLWGQVTVDSGDLFCRMTPVMRDFEWTFFTTRTPQCPEWWNQFKEWATWVPRTCNTCGPCTTSWNIWRNAWTPQCQTRVSSGDWNCQRTGTCTAQGKSEIWCY